MGDRSDLAWNEAAVYSQIGDAGGVNGIVPIVGISGTEKHFVRVLERARRGTLQSFLFNAAKGNHGSIDISFARANLSQIAETMASIHAMSIVHRDLKAENILMFGEDTTRERSDITAKVADFDRATDLMAGELLRQTVGSPMHTAPEIIAGKPYDRKVDVYSFGILMFEVLHGAASPYSNVANCMPGSMTHAELADKVVTESYRPNWLHDDAELRDLARTCWAPDPGDRPEFEEISRRLTPKALTRMPTVHTEDGNESECHPKLIENVGLASDIGKERASMEDSACVLSTADMLVACVSDGLRGHRTSEVLARQFALILTDGTTAYPTLETAARHTFKCVESTLRRLEPPIDCGSTAVTAIVTSAKILVAWVGDSPAYLFRRTCDGSRLSAVQLGDPHKPSREDEAIRVQAHGGIVGRETRVLDNGDTTHWGPQRVFVSPKDLRNGIAISRALGLFACRPAISSEPQILEIERQDDDAFMVLGSDGVFDCLPLERMRQILLGAGSSQAAADAIIAAVLDIGAPDNAAVVVIDMTKHANRVAAASRNASASPALAT